MCSKTAFTKTRSDLRGIAQRHHRYLGVAANRNAICTTSAIGLASGPPVRAG